MYQSINMPLCPETVEAFESWEGLRRDCAALGVDGVEGIWAGVDIPADFPKDLLVGYHLTFYPDWLDFYREDKQALRRKFGSVEKAYEAYGTRDHDFLRKLYREDLLRAASLGAKYVVFHVSDVSMEECYTFSWLHSDKEVIDASAEVLNDVMHDLPLDFELLLENQWCAGFRFTDPNLTAHMLDAVQYEKRGILLDTGHLMITRPQIRSQMDAVRYIQIMLDKHGSLSQYIHGMHLHQSLSGAYIRRTIGADKFAAMPEDFLESYGGHYAHIQKLDRHRPWTYPGIANVLTRIMPRYLTHELSAPIRKARMQATGRQIQALKNGGMFL